MCVPNIQHNHVVYLCPEINEEKKNHIFPLERITKMQINFTQLELSSG